MRSNTLITMQGKSVLIKLIKIYAVEKYGKNVWYSIE